MATTTTYNWVIPFTSFDGNRYEVRIAKTNGDTYDSVLTGATDVISIEEDDDDYMFVPVRTQSGYVRILYTGGTDDQVPVPYNWHDLVPAGARTTPVVLFSTDDNEIIWRGYVQPTVFESQYHDQPSVIELPICGLLDVLGSVDFDPGTAPTLTLAGVIGRALEDGLGEMAWQLEDLFFQGVSAIDAGNTSSWLLYGVSAGLFKEYDSDGTATLRYTCLEVLEHVCRFFGLTCRSNGVNVMFVSPYSMVSTMGFTKITLQDLASIDSGGFPQIQTYSASWIERTGVQFLDNKNTEAYMAGVRDVKVTEDVDVIDDLIDIPIKDLSKWLLKKNGAGPMPGGPVTAIRYGGANGHGCWYTSKQVYDDAVESSARMGNLLLEFPPVQVPGEASVAHYAWCEIQDWDDGAYGDNGAGQEVLLKHSYDWTPRIRLRGTGSAQQPRYVPGQPILVVTSQNVVSLANGVLVLNITTRLDRIVSNAHKTYNGAGVLYLSIGIGDKWWNPENPYGGGSGRAGSWESTEAVMAITVGGSEVAEGEGKLATNRVLSGMLPNDTATHRTGPYPPYTGFGIPVEAGLTGQVCVRIYGVYSLLTDSADVSAGVDLTELSLEFLRGDEYEDWNDRDTNTYTKQTDYPGEDDRTVDNILATDDNNAPGNGLLIHPDGGYAYDMEYESSGGGGQYVPREVLGNMIAAYYNRSRHQLQWTVYDWHPAEMPRAIYTIGGKRYYPISCSYKFADDACTIKLMEIDN